MKRIVAFTMFFACVAQSLQADNWLQDYETAKKEALATNKLILMDFWANWSEPCEKMQEESWSQDDIKALIKNYVPLRIDIDDYKSLASRYRVRAVPFTLIADANGRVLYKKMGYKNKDEITELLKKYTLKTDFVSNELNGYSKKESFLTAYRLATKYQDFSMEIDDDLKEEILSLSDNYFNESLNYLSTSSLTNKGAFRQKINLFKIQRFLILGQPLEAHKALKAFQNVKIDKINTSLYSFLNYVSLSLLKRNKEAESWLKTVNSIDKKRIVLFLPVEVKSDAKSKD